MLPQTTAVRGFHLRVAEAVRPDFAARRAFYGSDLARRADELAGVTSRLVLEGENGAFAAVASFFASPDDAVSAEERLAPMRDELDAAQSAFGAFRPVADLRGVVLGAIRVNAAAPNAHAIVGIGRGHPPPPIPGQPTLFLSVLRATDGTLAFIHVATSAPPDTWPSAEFLGRGVVVHVDRGDAMP
jgi:hypothetical protein